MMVLSGEGDRCSALALGSNDTANATGPFSAVYLTYSQARGRHQITFIGLVEQLRIIVCYMVIL